MIKKLSISIENYIKEFQNLVLFLIIMLYFKFSLYFFNYNSIFNPLNDKEFSLISIIRYSIFSLSFISIISITIFIISFLTFLITKKLKKLYKFIVFILMFLLEITSYIYIYTDLHIYNTIGVHIHNDIVLGAINKKDLSNDAALTSTKVLSFLTYPAIVFIIILFSFSLLIFFKSKLSLQNLFKKIIVYLSIPAFLSIFIVMYFWINLNDELTAIPLWSYIENSHISSNFESNYGEGFKYEQIKIKNKKNIIIIISESFRKDVYNKENMPNIFKFQEDKIGFINSKHHFSAAHFTLTSIFSLWYSIWGYHYKACLNRSNYKAPIPIEIFNKLGYDTAFLTSSYLVPSFEKFKQATKSFKTYKTFKLDKDIIDYFKKHYKSKEKNKPFLTMIFFNSSHYQYLYPKKFAKYSPALEVNDSKLFTKTISYDKNYKYKEKMLNRYKNSVLYTDHLFKEIISTLSDEDKKNTIIIFIGDHGEEFWEYGYLGHTRVSYTKELTEVPFMFYIPGLNKNIDIEVSSHTDIMTTLVSYITNIKDSDILNFFNGISLLNKKSLENHSFVISSYNFMGLKSKIALISKSGKLTLKSKTNKIKDENLFKIIKFNDFNDKDLTSKRKKNSLLNDFKEFQKNYLRFINLDEK